MCQKNKKNGMKTRAVNRFRKEVDTTYADDDRTMKIHSTN